MSKIIFILAIFFFLWGCAGMNSSSEMTSYEWGKDTMRATGFGVAPQGGNPGQQKLMAERAAKINAINNLMLQIRNLPVEQGKNVGHYLPSTWQPKGFVEESKEHQADGVCVMTVSMPLEEVWQVVQENKDK